MNDNAEKTTLQSWCSHCNADGYISIDSLDDSYIARCSECNRLASSQVYCEDCGVGGDFVDDIETRPQSWNCPDCSKEYPLDKSIYENPIELCIGSMPEEPNSKIYPLYQDSTIDTKTLLIRQNVKRPKMAPKHWLLLFLIFGLVAYFIWSMSLPVFIGELWTNLTIYYLAPVYIGIGLWMSKKMYHRRNVENIKKNPVAKLSLFLVLSSYPVFSWLLLSSMLYFSITPLVNYFADDEWSVKTSVESMDDGSRWSCGFTHGPLVTFSDLGKICISKYHYEKLAIDDEVKLFGKRGYGGYAVKSISYIDPTVEPATKPKLKILTPVVATDGAKVPVTVHIPEYIRNNMALDIFIGPKIVTTVSVSENATISSVSILVRMKENGFIRARLRDGDKVIYTNQSTKVKINESVGNEQASKVRSDRYRLRVNDSNVRVLFVSDMNKRGYLKRVDIKTHKGVVTFLNSDLLSFQPYFSVVLTEKIEGASINASWGDELVNLGKIKEHILDDSYSIESAEFQRYLSEWNKKVQRISRINYPPAARNLTEPATVQVNVILNVDGRISDIKVVKSSGNTELDDNVKQNIRLASPFRSLKPYLNEAQRSIGTIQFDREFIIEPYVQ